MDNNEKKYCLDTAPISNKKIIIGRLYDGKTHTEVNIDENSKRPDNANLFFQKSKFEIESLMDKK